MFQCMKAGGKIIRLMEKKLINVDGDVYNVFWLNDKAHGYGVICHLDDIQIFLII